MEANWLNFNPFLVSFIGVFLTTFVILKVRDSRQSKEKKLRYPPSIPSLPIVGSLFFMKCGGLYHRLFAEKAKTLGPIFTCYLGSKLVLVLNDRKSIDDALFKKTAHFSGRHRMYGPKFYYNPLAKGLINRQYGEEFRAYRMQLLSILKEFGLGQSQMEQRIIREAEELIDHIQSLNGQPFNPAELVSLCTLNIVASILFGNRLDQTDPALRKLNEAIHDDIHSNRFFLTFLPALRFLPFYKESIKNGFRVLKTEFDFIKNGITSSLEVEKTKKSFVTSFIERFGTYDKEDLIYTCRDLLQAGSDTTASSIVWSMALLANNPDIQRRLHEEIDSAINSNNLPTVGDMIKVPYVEATILEVLRFKTVLPLSLPHRVMSDTTIGNYFIPGGTMVFPNLYAVHMDEKVWENPDIFTPERFLDASGNVTGRNRIIPFSIGRRSCLGEGIARQELFILFTSLLQRFEIRPPDGQEKVKCLEMPATIIGSSPYEVRLIPRR